MCTHSKQLKQLTPHISTCIYKIFANNACISWNIICICCIFPIFWSLFHYCSYKVQICQMVEVILNSFQISDYTNWKSVIFNCLNPDRHEVGVPVEGTRKEINSCLMQAFDDRCQSYSYLKSPYADFHRGKFAIQYAEKSGQLSTVSTLEIVDHVYDLMSPDRRISTKENWWNNSDMLGMRYSHNSWAERYAKTVSHADTRILNADKKGYQVDTSELMVLYFQRASDELLVKELLLSKITPLH